MTSKMKTLALAILMCIAPVTLEGMYFNYIKTKAKCKNFGQRWAHRCAPNILNKHIDISQKMSYSVWEQEHMKTLIGPFEDGAYASIDRYGIVTWHRN